MTTVRDLALVVSVALVALLLRTGAVSASEQYKEIPGVPCQADRVDKPANSVSPVVLNGHAEVLFPGFQLRAGRVELNWNRESKGDKSILVQADREVVLRQGTQELRFHNLTFEADLPK